MPSLVQKHSTPGPALGVDWFDMRDVLHSLLIGAFLVSVAPAKTFTLGVVISLGATLWASAGGVRALCKGLSMIHEREEDRGFITRAGTALALTISAMIAVIIALALVAAFPVMLGHLGLGSFATGAAEVARWLLLIHHLPGKPDYLRVKVRRRLARLGAVPIRLEPLRRPPVLDELRGPGGLVAPIAALRLVARGSRANVPERKHPNMATQQQGHE